MVEYLYIPQMDIPPELEADFNRVYDTDHIPKILTVPGVLGCNRYVLQDATVVGIPKYAAMYRITSPDVFKSPEWRAASDRGEWKPKIRPHTQNRMHALYRALP